MNDDELRALVRDAIARARIAPVRPEAGTTLVALHSSHGLFTLPVGSDTDGPCLIEPVVMCNHCGYCKTLGH